MTLAAELVVLAGFSAGWLASDGHPAGSAHLTLLAVAAAMGMQSTAVRHLGQMSSTYLTSTLTGILEALAGGGCQRHGGAASAPPHPDGRRRAWRGRRDDSPSLVPVIVLFRSRPS